MIKLKQILLEGKMGDCYPAAGRLAIEMLGDKKVILVHGMVNGQGMLEGKRFGHAWVEYDNRKVMDHSNGKQLEVPKDAYYALGGVKEEDNKYYLPNKAIRMMTKSMHWGPWEMSGDTVMAEEIPDANPEIGKHDIRINPNELEDIEQLI